LAKTAHASLLLAILGNRFAGLPSEHKQAARKGGFYLRPFSLISFC